MIDNEPIIDVNGRFYDIYKGLENSDDLIVRLKFLIDFSFVPNLLNKYYCDNNGRPAMSPIFMIKLQFLKHLENLSDRDLIRRINNDLSYKFFLNLNPDDRDFIDYTSISKFRKLRLTPLIEDSEKNMVLNKFIAESLKLAKKIGIPISGDNIYDSTHTISKYNSYSSVEILESLSKKLRQAIYNIDEKYSDIMPVKPISKDIIEHINYCKTLLEVVAANIEDIEKLEGPAPRFYRYLKEIIEEGLDNFNSIDKDAKIGHKSEDNAFFGYKTHIAINKDRLITGALLTGGEASDSKQATNLTETIIQNGVKVTSITGDGAYSATEIIKDCKVKEIELVAKLSNTIVNSKLPEGVVYNKDIDNLVCGAGEVSIRKEKDIRKSKNEEPVEYDRYFFDINKCKLCSKREGCYKKNSKSKSIRVRVGMTPSHQMHQEFQETDRAKELAKERYKIEAKNAELKNNFDYRKTKYENIAGMEIQAVLTIFASNVMRIMKMEDEKSRK